MHWRRFFKALRRGNAEGEDYLFTKFGGNLQRGKTALGGRP